MSRGQSYSFTSEKEYFTHGKRARSLFARGSFDSYILLVSYSPFRRRFFYFVYGGWCVVELWRYQKRADYSNTLWYHHRRGWIPGWFCTQEYARNIHSTITREAVCTLLAPNLPGDQPLQRFFFTRNLTGFFLFPLYRRILIEYFPRKLCVHTAGCDILFEILLIPGTSWYTKSKNQGSTRIFIYQHAGYNYSTF